MKQQLKTFPADVAVRGRSAEEARASRKREVTQVRRSLVLTAAQAAFFELGLEGASLREIAKRAGYSPGAIYSYFDSKEEVYGALLGESLERLNAFVAAASPDPVIGRGRIAALRARDGLARAKATAFFTFYRENPRDLDLGFYLFQGMQPRGLTPRLNDQLNARLRSALSPVHDELVALGTDPAVAQVEVTALFAHSVGLLLLNHTGRIRMFHQDATELFQRYLDGLLARTPEKASAPSKRARPRKA